MKVTKKILALLAVCSFLLYASVTWSYAATINAASASFSDVASAVSSAKYGDTVFVPAGEATWNSTLYINKGINLIGAGVGLTIISSTSSSYIINWTPSNPALDEPFRLSGFTFDLNSTSAALYMGNTSATPSTQVRVDHNYFKDCIVSNAAFEVRGVYGVVDNNTFDGSPHLDNYGANAVSWTNLTFAYGTANNLYYEDNYFTKNDGVPGNQFAFGSGGVGGRYCHRYNTYSFNSNAFPVWDAHGNMGGGGNHGTMGLEFYGNYLDTGSYVVKTLHQRGGRGLMFYNYHNGGSSAYAGVVEEHCDELNPPATAPDGMPQHVSDSYYWNNRTSTDSVVSVSMETNTCGTYQIAANVDFWNFNTNFDGTTGTGCGTLASRPSTCTTGVGYWATDQSCSSVPTESVGVNPTIPLSGTLYKCTSTNTWTEYYTPYTYPHPLTIATSEDTTPPVCSGGSPTGTLPSGTISTTLSLTTNENATCRYSTTPGVSYSSMTDTFSTTGGTSHSTTISGLSDGDSYSYSVRCQDDSGNVNTSDYGISFSVAVPDFEPPTIPSGLQASSVSSSQINLTWTASTDDIGVAGYTIYRDGVQVDTSPANSYSDTGLSPSTTYTYTVSAYDAEGNESSQSSSASATTPAAPAVIEAQSGTITSPMQIVSDVDASGGAYIQTIQANSGTAAYAFYIDESGIYKIIARVYAFDAGSDSFYVKIDDGEEFVWHLNPSQFNVWREDEVTATGDDPYTIELTQGTHTITFRGRETNCRLDYFYFLKVEGLDEESPRVTITQPTSGNTYSTEEDTITLGGSASDNIGVTSVTWTNSRGGNDIASGTDNWTMSNIPLQEGDNTITVTAHDAAGNTGSDTLTVTYTPPDFQPPTIPGNLQASSVSSSQINLTWTASTDDVGVTGYIIYRDGVQVDTSPTNSYSDIGLFPSTTYTYTVSAYDAEGNESSQSSSASATTPAAAPAFIEAQSGTITSPMQIVSDAEASGGAYIQTTQENSGTATYTFNIEESGIYKIIARVYAFDAGSDSFYVKIDEGEEFIWHLNPSGNPDEFNVWREDEVTATGDDPYTVELTQGTHTITFRGRETNCRLDYFYFSKVEGLDEESPMVTITQPTSGNTYSTEEDSINLGGSASDNIGVTSVTWTNSRGGNGIASGTDNWTMSNIPLQEGDNTITVTAHDAAGNTGSDTLTVTYTPPDFQPPTIPSNLLASPVSSSQINLTWTASTDDVGITGYIIYRDGVQVDTSPANSYSDTGLSPSTTYTYTVSAYDAAGNESSQSSSASATTPAAAPAPAFIEAQSGTITSPMQIVSDAEASEGTYIQTIQADSGTATYTFNIDESGIYKIIARVYAFDAGSDSFYVKIDDGEEFVWHLNPSQSPDEFNVWREDEVTATGDDPYTVELTQGTHTITFRGRETNCRLDYFYFLKVEGLSAPKNFSIIN